MTPHHTLRVLAELRQRQFVAEVERDRLVHHARSAAGSLRPRERRAERRRRLAYVVSMVAAIALALLAALASIRGADALVVPSPLPPEEAAAACGAATAAAAGRPPAARVAWSGPPTGVLGGKDRHALGGPAAPGLLWEPLDVAAAGDGRQALALTRLTAAPDAVAALNRPLETILLAVESGRVVITLAAGEARVGRADAKGGPLAPCVPTTLSPGDWLAVEPGAVLAARNVGSEPAVAVASTLVELPKLVKL